MPYYRLIPNSGNISGSVMPIVLQRCPKGLPEFVLSEQPQDIPPQLVLKAKPVIARMGYRLLEVPTPDELEAQREEEEDLMEEEPAFRPPPQIRNEGVSDSESSTTHDEKEEVS